jgi:predicted transposase YbfD/YdcC
MQSTAVLPLLDAHTAAGRETPSPEDALATLPAVFASVPDPRSRHGQRYDLPFLLTCLVAALLCGCDALDAVGQWTYDRRTLLRRQFGPRRHLTPTGSLYRRLLPRLSAAHLEAALAAWVRQTRPLRDREPVAFDGKVVRGAVTITQPAPHLLSVSTHDTGETLLQVRVDDKTNEIPIAQAVLPHLPLRGRVVTADALHTQTATAQVILDQHADYGLVGKDNQPRLHAELVAYFADPRATARSATTTDRSHGRTETRTVHATARLCPYLTPHFPFPRIGQVARLVRTVREKGQTRTETVYLITSLTPRRATPVRLLALIRGHWSIEVRHRIRDVTFGEDHSRLRGGEAPQIMAALRNLALTLMRRAGHTAIAAYRRHLSTHPATALRLLRPRTHSRR